MKALELKAGAISTRSSIAQIGVGCLDTDTLAYTLDYPESHIHSCYELTIQKAETKDTSWGKVLFQGSLEELIEILEKEKKDGSNPRGTC